MKLLAILNRLTSFLTGNRGSGTTTLLKKIAEENDVWVLVPTEEMSSEFGDKGITLSHLPIGGEKKPILFDNYTLIYLTEAASDEILGLMEKIRRRDDLIRDIEAKISVYKLKDGLLYGQEKIGSGEIHFDLP